MTYAAVGRAAAAAGLALRGGFQVAPGDGVVAATVLMLGWTGGMQWPVFAASAEFADGRANPLDRWSRRVVGGLAAEFGAVALYPFGGPPFLPFLRWAVRAEALFGSPIGLLVHPEFGLWHAWRGALAFAERMDVPAVAERRSPCEGCARYCLEGGREACPVGTPYGDAQMAFHTAAYRRGIMPSA